MFCVHAFSLCHANKDDAQPYNLVCGYARRQHKCLLDKRIKLDSRAFYSSIPYLKKSYLMIDQYVMGSRLGLLGWERQYGPSVLEI